VRGLLSRAAVVALLAQLALGGAFGHVDGLEILSQGTQLFAPDHPAHAPFVPQREHACASCAVANVTPPASAPVFLVPRVLCAVHETRVERRDPASVLPDLSGRSPPSLTA
jgi:hypothetical protein